MTISDNFHLSNFETWGRPTQEGRLSWGKEIISSFFSSPLWSITMTNLTLVEFCFALWANILSVWFPDPLFGSKFQVSRGTKLISLCAFAMPQLDLFQMTFTWTWTDLHCRLGSGHLMESLLSEILSWKCSSHHRLLTSHLCARM